MEESIMSQLRPPKQEWIKSLVSSISFYPANPILVFHQCMFPANPMALMF